MDEIIQTQKKGLSCPAGLRRLDNVLYYSDLADSPSHDDIIEDLDLREKIFRNEQDCTILSEQILKYFKCEQCGECCIIPVHIFPSEVGRFTEFSGKEWFRKNTYIDDGGCIMLLSPCPYFKYDKNCGCQDIKPFYCKRFPFIQQAYFYEYVFILLCPLGKKIVHSLKKFKEEHGYMKDENIREVARYYKKMVKDNDTYYIESKEVLFDFHSHLNSINAKDIK